MRVVLLGATKGMGRALARLMAERGDALFLLGRDRDDLERSAADLGLKDLELVLIGGPSHDRLVRRRAGSAPPPHGPPGAVTARSASARASPLNRAARLV